MRAEVLDQLHHGVERHVRRLRQVHLRTKRDVIKHVTSSSLFTGQTDPVQRNGETAKDGSLEFPFSSETVTYLLSDLCQLISSVS